MLYNQLKQKGQFEYFKRQNKTDLRRYQEIKKIFEDRLLYNQL
jgi:curli biogenesis system outer membrane secretion channel CsgG